MLGVNPAAVEERRTIDHDRARVRAKRNLEQAGLEPVAADVGADRAFPLAGRDATIARRHDGHVVPESAQRPRETAGDVGEAAGL